MAPLTSSLWCLDPFFVRAMIWTFAFVADGQMIVNGCLDPFFVRAMIWTEGSLQGDRVCFCGSLDPFFVRAMIWTLVRKTNQDKKILVGGLDPFFVRAMIWTCFCGICRAPMSSRSRSLFRQGNDLDRRCWSSSGTVRRKSRSLFRQGNDLDGLSVPCFLMPLSTICSLDPFFVRAMIWTSTTIGTRAHAVSAGLDPFFVRAMIWTLRLAEWSQGRLTYGISIPFSSGQ